MKHGITYIIYIISAINTKLQHLFYPLKATHENWNTTNNKNNQTWFILATRQMGVSNFHSGPGVTLDKTGASVTTDWRDPAFSSWENQLFRLGILWPCLIANHCQSERYPAKNDKFFAG